MKTEVIPKNYLFPLWLKFILIITLLIGIFIRFSKLDTKVYWSHESFTSLRISGYTISEVVAQTYDGRELSPKDIQKYLHPNSEKGLSDAIKSLAIEDSQHPPLYFGLARFWAQTFGSSVSMMRILPDLFSLLALPCFYWLCIELFESSLVGWVVISLSAVSLLHVIYAQEARQYSLWIVTTLLSNAVLLRGLRSLNPIFDWGSYAISLSLGLYTYPLTGLVAIAHGIYVFVMEGYKLSRTVIYYLIASLLALLSFMPWLWTMIIHRDKLAQTIDLSTNRIPFLYLARLWLSHITMIFTSQAKLISVILISFLVGYSIYYLIRHAPQRVWLFVVLLITIPALGIILPDLIFGGIRSAAGRYQWSSYLGIQLAVAYLFTHQITSLSGKRWQRQLWQILLIALLVVEVRICFKYYQSYDGWAKNDNYNPPMASIINQAKKPVLISELNQEQDVGSILSLSYYLDSDVKLKLVIPPNLPKIADSYSDIFIYSNSEELRSKMENKIDRKAVVLYQDDNPVNQNPVKLWELKKN